MKRALTAIGIAAAILASQAYAETPGAGFLTTSCQLGDAVVPGSGNTIVVDQSGAGDAETIGEAVAAAEPGDEILIKPGVYAESVDINTPSLLIRGEDRNTVELDGENKEDLGLNALADTIVMENMTGHNYTGTAFRWAHQTGFWGRYLTAYNNQGYGIYAFDARCGQFEQTYTSGNADAGLYIGECFPCDAVIFDSVAEENALGYSGTNAGGNLEIRDSIWRDNALGIVPNSLVGEKRPPQRGATIKNNLIEGGRNDVPGVGFAGTYWGTGIAIAGGVSNHVYGNTITGQQQAGIVVVPLPETSGDVWIPSGNIIWGNTLDNPDAIADLAQAAGSGPANCWSDNAGVDGAEITTAPPMLQTMWSCELAITPPGGDARVEVALVDQTFNEREKGEWQTWPAPEPQVSAPLDMGVMPWLPALLGV